MGPILNDPIWWIFHLCFSLFFPSLRLILMCDDLLSRFCYPQRCFCLFLVDSGEKLKIINKIIENSNSYLFGKESWSWGSNDFASESILSDLADSSAFFLDSPMLAVFSSNLWVNLNSLHYETLIWKLRSQAKSNIYLLGLDRRWFHEIFCQLGCLAVTYGTPTPTVKVNSNSFSISEPRLCFKINGLLADNCTSVLGKP